jgi:hypothetical protein
MVVESACGGGEFALGDEAQDEPAVRPVVVQVDRRDAVAADPSVDAVPRQYRDTGAGDDGMAGRVDGGHVNLGYVVNV